MAHPWSILRRIPVPAVSRSTGFRSSPFPLSQPEFVSSTTNSGRVSPVPDEYNESVPDPSSLQKVLDHLQLYEHPLLAFSARENNGVIEVLIDLKNSTVPVHTYVLPIHPRDLDHPQFAWHLQHQLYDGLHDYFIEMFIRTPQDRAVPRSPRPGGEGSQGS